MANLYLYSISKPDGEGPALINADDYSYDSYPLTYEFENHIEEWKKEHAVLVTVRHKTIDLFRVLSQITGFNVTSATSRFSDKEFEGYIARSAIGESKFVSDEVLEKYRETVEEPGYLFNNEKISETDSWYYSVDDGVDLEGRPLTDEDLIKAMIRVVRDEEECWTSIGEVLFALTKALEAVREGKTVYAVVE